MGVVIDNVDDLPSTPVDGQEVVVAVGPGQRTIEKVYFNAAENVWIGRPKLSYVQIETIGMQGGLTMATWGYPAAGEHSNIELGYSFKLYDVPDADLLWAAGLRFQEQWNGQLRRMHDQATQEDPRLALTWWSLDDEDAFLSPPTEDHGLRLHAKVSAPDDTYRTHNLATGWVDSPMAGFTKNGYPEIYLLGSLVFRRCVAKHRWVVGAGAGNAGMANLPDAEAPPFNPFVMAWYDAKQIPQADGDPVPDLTDWSSRVIHLQQATASKRPTVMSEGGVRFIRFDGTNDALAEIDDLFNPREGRLGIAQPLTAFMVMRERSGGGSTQVFYASKLGNMPLVYRDGGTIHVWAQGSGDAIYTTALLTDWTVHSVEFASTAGSIWHNLTEVFAGDVGPGGFGTGLRFGNNEAGAFPAKFDLAEFVVVFRTISDVERTEMVEWLAARNGITI